MYPILIVAYRISPSFLVLPLEIFRVNEEYFKRIILYLYVQGVLYTTYFFQVFVPFRYPLNDKNPQGTRHMRDSSRRAHNKWMELMLKNTQ